VAGTVSAHLYENNSIEPAMSYQVLARKWRPHNFNEVVGQEHVVKSLINALQHDRLHHAYLFTGTRGVGKTTIARILAKAINCENRTDHNPCGECAICQDLDAGRFLDLIEVDAASRTKVEDTRDLLDNAQYAPNQGKYKVYLIDEVHMLSGHSFNALLKTLEEPPAHVKFLLATTDPQKIPVTVLSRCLQFNLKRLLPEQIIAQMEFILGQEKIEFEIQALQMLARAADGSMRDGLSLLDQAVVFGQGKVRASDIREMLGIVAQQPVENLLLALAAADATKILEHIAAISELTTDFSDVLQQMLRLLHHIALAKVAPGAVAHEQSAELIDTLEPLFTAEDLQLYYQIGLIGQRDLDLAPDPRSGFEMVMLRMLTFRPADHEDNSKLSVPTVVDLEPVTLPTTVKTGVQQEPEVISAIDNWTEMIIAMKIGGMTRELANNCVLEKIDDKSCLLLLDPGHKQLLSSKTAEKLQKAIQNYTGKPVKLVINTEKSTTSTPALQINQERQDKQQAAEHAIETDENIQALRENFDARVISGTIEPV
jgi:DNA polymerase III subunit gamma/tau